MQADQPLCTQYSNTFQKSIALRRAGHDHHNHTVAVSRRVGWLVRACLWLLIGGCWFWFGGAAPVQAQAPETVTNTTVLTESMATGNATAPDSACKLCHVGSQAAVELPSGESFSVDVETDVLQDSVHGEHFGEDVYCTDCHLPRERYIYPHAENPAENYAEFQADIAQNCDQCHLPLELHNPGHLLAEKTADLPNCVDCHGGHAAMPADTLAADPMGTCRTCHVQVGQTDLPATVATSRTITATLAPSETVQAMHAMVVGNLSNEGPTCQTCHADEPPASLDAECTTCHNLLEGDLTLASGETIPLQVHPQRIMESVHGERTLQGVEYPALQCVDCHSSERYTFPHDAVAKQDSRDFTLARQEYCQGCHEDITALNETSVHAIALAEGNRDAATCTDCHGAHDVQPPDEPRAAISQTCAQCHSTIHEQYTDSVHGEALIGEENPDVPVCTDCHGVHNITDPTTALFRLRSPQLCAECHADEELMAKYDVSTEVFDTYVADFHGSTLTLFEERAPDQPPNTAVCYDCHGVHNILAADDENSHVIKENLLATCQECHPDATTNFPNAWMSHFQPSWEHNRLVYIVNLFYQILIPTLMGGFILFIGSDIARRWWDRRTVRRREGDEEAGADGGPDNASGDGSTDGSAGNAQADDSSAAENEREGGNG